jgi:methionyl-tRNA formyltransferase
MAPMAPHVLLLAPARHEGLAVALRSRDLVVTQSDHPLTDLADERLNGPTHLVAFGYRYKVPAAILRRAWAVPPINLHISYLPWNKGAHPILWSVLDDTPAGVTVHQMDEAFDTGPILVQARLTFRDDETFRAAHARAEQTLTALCLAHWDALSTGTRAPQPQTEPGTRHTVREYASVADRLPQGWETPIGTVRAART